MGSFHQHKNIKLKQLRWLRVIHREKESSVWIRSRTKVRPSSTRREDSPPSSYTLVFSLIFKNDAMCRMLQVLKSLRQLFVNFISDLWPLKGEFLGPTWGKMTQENRSTWLSLVSSVAVSGYNIIIDVLVQLILRNGSSQKISSIISTQLYLDVLCWHHLIVRHSAYSYSITLNFQITLLYACLEAESYSTYRSSKVRAHRSEKGADDVTWLAIFQAVSCLLFSRRLIVGEAGCLSWLECWLGGTMLKKTWKYKWYRISLSAKKMFTSPL